MLKKLNFSPYFILLAIMFMLAPFYSQPNIGGSGLHIPNNITVWMVAIWFVSYAAFKFATSEQFFYPRNYGYFIAFPASIIIIALVADISRPIDWLFRVSFIFGGLLFLMSLFQAQLKQRQIETLLYFLVISVAGHGLVGVIQVKAPQLLVGTGFVHSVTGLPDGVFRQINLQATFMVTGMMVSLYLISRPSFLSRPRWLQFGVLVSFSLATYVVFTSGSRTGLLALVAGLVLLLLARKRQFGKRKKLSALFAFVFVSSALLGYQGLENIRNKTELMFEPTASIRLNLYDAGIDLVKKEPILGHGIGRFTEVWYPHQADYQRRYPQAIFFPDDNIVIHPHNELLLWAIEGGLFSLVGIFLFFVGVVIALFRCGWQRGGAYAAILLPIGLHTQLELPFYLSSMHWFVWLFLLFIVISHQQYCRSVNFSQLAIRTVQFVALLVGLGGSYFFVHAELARSDLYAFIQNDRQPPFLQVAKNNIYFAPLTEQVWMVYTYYAGIQTDNRELLKNYISWAEAHIQTRPEIGIYDSLIKALLYLGYSQKACTHIENGLLIFRDNEKLLGQYKHCQTVNEITTK